MQNSAFDPYNSESFLGGKNMNEDKITSIKNLIYEIRGQKVMLDKDLAELYGVEIKRLNENVKRNIRRFPSEFMFQLSNEEWKNLRSQIATFNKNIRKFKPYAFTEHGILMLSSILNSDKAIDINIKIMKIFVKLRQYTLSKNGTKVNITELKKILMLHIENSNYKFSEHDKTINKIVTVLNNLIEKPKETKSIGFYTGK